MLNSIRNWLHARYKRKSREYWAKMDDKRAEEISFAIFYEWSAREAGSFMEEYERLKALGLTGTMERTFFDKLKEIIWVAAMLTFVIGGSCWIFWPIFSR